MVAIRLYVKEQKLKKQYLHQNFWVKWVNFGIGLEKYPFGKAQKWLQFLRMLSAVHASASSNWKLSYP